MAENLKKVDNVTLKVNWGKLKHSPATKECTDLSLEGKEITVQDIMNLASCECDKSLAYTSKFYNFGNFLKTVDCRPTASEVDPNDYYQLSINGVIASDCGMSTCQVESGDVIQWDYITYTAPNHDDL